MTTLRPEAAAARAQGARAADAGEPFSVCPHPAGGSLALNWLVGHALALDRQEAADIFRDLAKNARQRERRGQAREARAVAHVPVVKPERPSKPCALAGCTGRVVWQSGRSRADFDRTLYCCHACRMAGLTAGSAGRRRGGKARPPPPKVKSEPVAPTLDPSLAVVTPRPITPGMWHAARDGVSADAMRRLFGLDDGQVAKVLEMQRQGRRKAA